MLRPRSNKVSLRISPGCTGGSLSIVLRDFDALGISVPPDKADAVLIVDPDTVLPFSVSPQRFEAVAWWNQQIGKCMGTIQGHKPAQRNRRDMRELPRRLPVKKPFGLFAPEGPDHMLRIGQLTLYVKRQTTSPLERRKIEIHASPRGIIKEDKLGLDMVYVQAKKYSDNPVGRPSVQAFAGSLEGHRARKGVMITTSTFSQDARDYVQKIEKKIVLIDGKQLAQFMIEHDVGVTVTKVYRLKKLDQDFFDSE